MQGVVPRHEVNLALRHPDALDSSADPLAVNAVLGQFFREEGARDLAGEPLVVEQPAGDGGAFRSQVPGREREGVGRDHKRREKRGKFPGERPERRPVGAVERDVIVRHSVRFAAYDLGKPGGGVLA